MTMQSKIKESKTKERFSCLMAMTPRGKTRDQIIEYGRSILDADILVDKKLGCIGRDPKPHVTIKYGIHRATWEGLRTDVPMHDVGHIQMTLLGLSSFENDGYDVLKIGIDSSSLHELNERITSNTKTTETYPTYIPHMTVAYLKPGKAQQYIDRDASAFRGMVIDTNILLFSSKDGSERTILL